MLSAPLKLHHFAQGLSLNLATQFELPYHQAAPLRSNYESAVIISAELDSPGLPARDSWAVSKWGGVGQEERGAGGRGHEEGEVEAGMEGTSGVAGKKQMAGESGGGKLGMCLGKWGAFRPLEGPGTLPCTWIKPTLPLPILQLPGSFPWGKSSSSSIGKGQLGPEPCGRPHQAGAGSEQQWQLRGGGWMGSVPCFA